MEDITRADISSISPPDDDRLSAAAGYARRGWHVFVLSPGKVPIRNCTECTEHTTTEAMEACTCLTCHGFYAATNNLERITEMLRRHPRGLLAIRTGAISGIAVVDVDIENYDEDGFFPRRDDIGFQTLTKLDEKELLPGTLMQTTGSGGLHLLYAHPGGYLMSGTGKYGPKVDSKADAAYIVVAPSRSKAGPYKWSGDGRYDHPLTPIPDALAAYVRPPHQARQAVTPSRPGDTRGRLSGLLNFVMTAADGERNDKLYWAAKKAGAMIATGEVDEHTAVGVLQDAGRAIHLTTNEIGDARHGTIGSGLRKGLVSA